MRYDASDDQRLLQATTRRFLEQHSPIAAVRQLLDDADGFDRDLWHHGAELGWASMFVPEAFGGMAEAAMGAIDAAIIAEELGRVVFTGPFVAVNVVASALATAGTDEQRAALLPSLAAGDRVATWCTAAPGDRTSRVVAARDGDAWVLDGQCGWVEHAQVADVLLVTAAGDDGPTQLLVDASAPGIVVTPLEGLDLGRRLAAVRFDGVAVDAGAVLGMPGAAEAQIERQLQLAVVLQCAETVGLVDRALEMTIAYSKDRIAFGRLIGSFQALKHRMADHAMWLEAAKAITDHAAAAVHLDAADAPLAASMAKAHVGSCATEITRDCVQIHGGIGLTWEHDLHLFLRRAISNEALWGTPAAHRERLCELVGVD